MDPIDVGSAKPKHDPPVAMEPYDLGGPGDLGALSNEQQWHTNILKVPIMDLILSANIVFRFRRKRGLATSGT